MTAGLSAIALALTTAAAGKLAFALTSILSLRVAYTVRCSNEPVPTFERTDTITSSALVMKFRRPGP